MISVIIITKNEENWIKNCLESVKWADEIIVVDKGSTDGTVEITRKYTEKIITFTEEDYAKTRNKGAEIAKGDWLLYVDSDERVLRGLKEEIKNLVNTDECSAYAVSRINIIFGERVTYGSFWPDFVIRLIRKSDFEGWQGKIHEQPKFKGKLGYTANSLFHLTHRDVEQITKKSLEWSKIDAQLRLVSNHPKMNGIRFFRIFVAELFNQMILRKGIFGGTVGVVDSFLQTFSLFITYVRLWQLQRDKPLDEIYKDIDKRLLENKFEEK